MATSLIVEEESGTYREHDEHPHNGYFAGDFSEKPSRPMRSPAPYTESARRLTI